MKATQLNCSASKSVKRGAQNRSNALLAKERLRKRYLPPGVRILFVGESPPASGRFFYQADSGLYRAIREAFVELFPDLKQSNFLESFRDLGCYLLDLCPMPVDRLGRKERQKAWSRGEASLSRVLRRLQPRIVVIVVRSITENVKRSMQRADWRGFQLELAYPGRWHRHRAAFVRELVPLLRETYNREA